MYKKKVNNIIDSLGNEGSLNDKYIIIKVKSSEKIPKSVKGYIYFTIKPYIYIIFKPCNEERSKQKIVFDYSRLFPKATDVSVLSLESKIYVWLYVNKLIENKETKLLNDKGETLFEGSKITNYNSLF